ncbi:MULTISPECIES: alpha/beta hydrolase-fold protein [Maribacter]|uniref:Alpha/beta hydrolase-fold protein n=1 Tax=Maribacter flavus TaxID=1658664 RepID=A0ABU7IHI0_9FLAO|nr:MULTISPECIES: alpha/beta hydrolase-fold protein [Maribacter]MDC6404899.1 alpha/beta hydrolase-fold protein [Maribacter sp. PR66]MEE1972313.1 alpha/beta hydrolase-fold protein [Maribacter flavus]
MIRNFCLACIALLLLGSCQKVKETTYSVNVRFSEAASPEAKDGRLLLMFSSDDSKEPRFQINDGLNTQLIFGMNVDSMHPGKPITFDETVFGYPYPSMADIPPGEYNVQALLHVYETFNLATGHTVKLPMDNGEGQQWNSSPGNLYSKPFKIRVGSNGIANVSVEMDQVIPPIEEPEDTEWIKHIKMKSEKLSEFYGRDIYLGAHVLLPKGFDEHPEAKYPLMVFHGHFPSDFGGFRTTPPDPNLEPDYSARFDMKGYNIIQQQEAYDFYKRWNEPDFPRFLIIEIQHPTPYYDDSYAVNSASQGPYGDAITYELIPYIEKEFRGMGEGWSRFLYGGSTGGWEALAVQVKYPEEYNGCFAACPDPIDFRAYCLTNIYEDENAYYYDAAHKKLEVPSHRDYLGNIQSTLRQGNHLELVLGDKSRSGQQWDIWEATYSPQGDDGYPVRIWDKMTGQIDHDVAEYWKENYDLRYIMERDWDKLGENLKGKIHIYCGDMDNYYLNNAVYLMEDFLESTTDPYYEGEVLYGDRAEHCWNGDPELPNAISRLRYNSMYVPKIMKRIAESAPKGADLTSWRYE